VCWDGETVVVAVVRKFGDDLFDQPGMLGLGQPGHSSCDRRASDGAGDESLWGRIASEFHVEGDMGIAQANLLG
jgi:hypothetical protein